jgi:adenosine deaminase
MLGQTQGQTQGRLIGPAACSRLKQGSGLRAASPLNDKDAVIPAVTDLDRFIAGLPKAELHIHIEGSLEPEMMFALARRNRVSIPFPDVEALRAAYQFSNLQDFLDIYYRGAQVLRVEEDFHDLALAYFDRAAADKVVHAEIFFDPQTHTARGIPFQVAVEGLLAGMAQAEARHGLSSRLILCFLRHLPEEDAFATLKAAEPWLNRITGVGLDSSELGHPPAKFAQVFAAAGEMGLKRVAHAGEEGPPAYVRGWITATDRSKTRS